MFLSKETPMDDTGLLPSGDDKKVVVVGLILPSANGVGKAGATAV